MAKFGFTYMFTHDLAASKSFYADTLGLDLIWDEADLIAFNIDGHQLSFQLDEDYKVEEAAFSKQLGLQGGVLPKVSGSIAYDQGKFAEVVEQLLAKDTIAFLDQPQWVGYWTFPVLDPMNQTIEITCTDEAG